MQVDTTETSSSACIPPPPNPLSVLQRLRASREHIKFIHIPNYVLCAGFAGIGGFIFGFDTGSIGPVTVMPQFQVKFSEGGKALEPTVQGLIVSSILLTASVASLFAGPLSDRISRTRTISLGGVAFAIGSAISCAASSLAMMFVGRCIAGAGEGLFLSTVTVYAVEIAPASNRGRLGSFLQLLNTIGIATGYFICYGTVHAPSSFSWRFPFGMQAGLSTIFAVGTALLPHSPRWLRHVGREAEAEAAWLTLGVAAAEAQKTEETVQRAEVPKAGWWKESQEMWKKGIRSRTALGIFLMGMQQASGIDGVLYYAPVLFSQAGLSSTTSSFMASGVSALMNVIGTFIVQFFADKWSRRITLIAGGTVIGVAMMLIGTLYASHASDHEAGRWAIIVLIYIFLVGFVTTWGINIRTVSTEIQPMRTRAAATSLGQCANWAINWVIAFSTPLFLARSAYGPYFLFGACCLLTALVCAAFQPETKGASLEEVDKAFEEAPWKAALRRHRSRRADRTVRQRASRREGFPDEDVEVEIEEIELPEVRYAGHWHEFDDFSDDY